MGKIGVLRAFVWGGACLVLGLGGMAFGIEQVGIGKVQEFCFVLLSNQVPLQVSTGGSVANRCPLRF